MNTYPVLCREAAEAMGDPWFDFGTTVFPTEETTVEELFSTTGEPATTEEVSTTEETTIISYTMEA